MKKFFEEFKAFISRGNVLDLAVGVIIGGAFSAIVSAFTDKIIMPLINFLLSLGGENGLESAYSFLKKVTFADGSVDLANSIYIDWGAFITAVLNFLIIAMTLFIIIKVAMKSNKLLSSAEGKFKDSLLTKEDLKELKARKISLRDTKAVKAYKDEKAQKLLEERQRAQEEAKKKAEEDRKNNPTEQDLLKEIRDLLKEKNTK